MESLISAELTATCNALGYFDVKTDKYFTDEFTLETVKDLIRYLRRDSETFDIRRQLGDTGVLQTDLLPMLKSYWQESDLFDVLIRLIVNLTTPALVLWEEEPPNEKSARNLYLQIEGHLQKYKQAFDDEAIWAVLSTKLSKILEIDNALRGEENGLIIERILILIRNVLYAPIDDAENRQDNDANVHDRVLWALHQSGLLDILLYMTSSESESVYYLHILEILSLMLREQKPSELAQTTFQRNQLEKVRDETELMMIRNRESIEMQKKVKAITSSRHSRFGGTYVVKSMKSISDNDLIYHRPLSQLEALNFDANKTKPKTPKNRFPIKATSIERRSAFSIRLLLKEFCTEFLNGSYNTLMYRVKDNLVRARAQNHDESYYLWAMRFFMEFNRCCSNNFEVKLVSETMSVQTFHYVQQQCEHHFDMLSTEKKKLHQWSRRLHLALLAYKELLRTLCSMDKSQEVAVRESSRVIKNNIFYVLEYREFILTLLLSYDELKMSDAYLRDLMETQHIFIKMLESFLANSGEVMVQSKVTRRRGKKKKQQLKSAQSTSQSNSTTTTVRELDANELHRMWDSISSEISVIMESNKEFSTDTPPFDATSDVPIDDQKAETMKKIQRKLRSNDFENAIGLLRAAREVWPENCSFGSDNMPIEEEFLALQDIFFADLGENVVPVKSSGATTTNQDDRNNENDDDDDDEEENEEEDEETEIPVYNEKSFKFEDFTKRLPHPKIVRACSLALKQFETNSPATNQCIIKLLHRIAFDCKMFVMVFQLSTFRTFQRIFALKDLQQYKELAKFATYIVRQFIKLSMTNKKLFIEALFWKNSKECWEIEHGYDGSQDKSTTLRRVWTEEQENEVRQLFVEHQQTNEQEDVVDWIQKNLIDQSKSRLQVLKKLKEMMLLVDYKKRKNNNVTRRDVAIWDEADENDLRNLFELHRTSDDPLKNILENLTNRKLRINVINKLLALGLIQNKGELLKKNARDGKKKNDKLTNRKKKSATTSTSLRTKIVKRKLPKKPVAQSKANIAKLLIEIIQSETIAPEAFDWLKESLSESIETDTERTEDSTDETVPLVPVAECEEVAMANATFQQLLKTLGISPPIDEQEKYWRIPSYLHASEINIYCEMIQQAQDKTLVIPTMDEEMINRFEATLDPDIDRNSDINSSANSDDDDDNSSEEDEDSDDNQEQFSRRNDNEEDTFSITELESIQDIEQSVQRTLKSPTQHRDQNLKAETEQEAATNKDARLQNSYEIEPAASSSSFHRRAMRLESDDEDDDGEIKEKRKRNLSSGSDDSDARDIVKRKRMVIESDDE